MSSIAEALKGGSPFVKWDELKMGATVAGRITRTEIRQATKFKSTEPDFWTDGTPKMQVIITIATDLRDPDNADDDGERCISINLWSGQKKALQAAIEAAKVDEPKVGQTFSATWVSGVGVAGDPRVFVYSLSGAAQPIAEALKMPAPSSSGADAATLAAINALPPEARAAALAAIGQPPF